LEPPRPIRANDIGIDEIPDFPKTFAERMIFPFVYEPGKATPARYAKDGRWRRHNMKPMPPVR
jgi:hypothetical protein